MIDNTSKEVDQVKVNDTKVNETKVDETKVNETNLNIDFETMLESLRKQEILINEREIEIEIEIKRQRRHREIKKFEALQEIQRERRRIETLKLENEVKKSRECLCSVNKRYGKFRTCREEFRHFPYYSNF